MRVLIISHNVFDDYSSMGRTLAKYFACFDKEELAQLYVHSEEPELWSLCENYYRISDMDAVKAVIHRKHAGKRIKKKSISAMPCPSYRYPSLKEHIYQTGRKKHAWTYILRDCIWALSKWDSKDLNNWISDFSPEAVYLASGDYAFIYEIAYKISVKYDIPLAVSCFDDYYFYNKNRNSLLGRLHHKRYMKTVRKTIDRSSLILTISEPMAKSYQRFFHKKSEVLYMSSDEVKIKYREKAKKIAYFGNLRYGRDEQLAEIGKALMELDHSGSNQIEVYSTETDRKYLAKMKPENGILFKGRVSQEEIRNILPECIAVIHTESFDPDWRKQTKYSISTKISDNLTFGPCLFAYGPENVASVHYLISGNAAFVAADQKRLKDELVCLLTDRDRRNRVLANARKLAEKNHNVRKNGQRLRKLIGETVEDCRREHAGG